LSILLSLVAAVARLVAVALEDLELRVVYL
jgi:hypothetical protein